MTLLFRAQLFDIVRQARFPFRSWLENSGSSGRPESVRSVHWRANSDGVIHCNAVKTCPVIVLVPDFDFASGVLQRQEPMRVEAFLPEASVEGIVFRVVGRLART